MDNKIHPFTDDMDIHPKLDYQNARTRGGTKLLMTFAHTNPRHRGCVPIVAMLKLKNGGFLKGSLA